MVSQSLKDMAHRAETEEDFEQLIRLCRREGIGCRGSLFHTPHSIGKGCLVAMGSNGLLKLAHADTENYRDALVLGVCIDQIQRGTQNPTFVHTSREPVPVDFGHPVSAEFNGCVVYVLQNGLASLRPPKYTLGNENLHFLVTNGFGILVGADGETTKPPVILDSQQISTGSSVGGGFL